MYIINIIKNTGHYQSVLKEISPGCSLEGLMLKLKLQYFGHLMWRADSLEKTLMLGKIESRRKRDDRGWDGWMASSTWWTWVLSKHRELVIDREAWHAAVHGVTKSRARLSNWTELIYESCWNKFWVLITRKTFFSFHFLSIWDGECSLNSLWQSSHDVCKSNHYAAIP